MRILSLQRIVFAALICSLVPFAFAGKGGGGKGGGGGKPGGSGKSGNSGKTGTNGRSGGGGKAATRYGRTLNGSSGTQYRRDRTPGPAATRKQLVWGFSSGAERKRSYGLSVTRTQSGPTIFSAFHPAGILNPLNPWNQINPMSPWFPRRHYIRQANHDAEGELGEEQHPLLAYASEEERHPQIIVTNDNDNCVVKNEKNEVTVRFDKIPISDPNADLILVNFPIKDKDFSLKLPSVTGAIAGDAYGKKNLRVEVYIDPKSEYVPHGEVRVREYKQNVVKSAMTMVGNLCDDFAPGKTWETFASSILVASDHATWDELIALLPAKPSEPELEAVDEKAQASITEAAKADMKVDDAELENEKLEAATDAEKEKARELEEYIEDEVNADMYPDGDGRPETPVEPASEDLK